MKKSYLVLALGFVNTIYSLGLVIDTLITGIKERQDYGTEIDFYFNSNYIVWLISGIIIIAIGFMLYKEEKNI